MWCDYVQGVGEELMAESLTNCKFVNGKETVREKSKFFNASTENVFSLKSVFWWQNIFPYTTCMITFLQENTRDDLHYIYVIVPGETKR